MLLLNLSIDRLKKWRVDESSPHYLRGFSQVIWYGSGRPVTSVSNALHTLGVPEQSASKKRIGYSLALGLGLASLFGSSIATAATDIVNVFNDGNSASIDVHQSNGTDKFTIQRWATKQGDFWDAQQWFSGDFNGDGLTDVAKAFNDGGSASIDVHLSNGTDKFTIQRWATKQGDFWDAQQWFSGDFNGDGFTDVAKVFNDGGSASIDVHLSNRTDKFTHQRWATKQGSFGDTQKWFSGNFNGDKFTDIVNVFNDGGLASIDVHQSNGSDKFTIQRWATKQGSFGDTQQWFSGNFNGDKFTDIVNVFNDGGLASIDVHQSNGSDKFTIQRWATKQGSFGDTQQWFSGNFNGDKFTDVAKAFNDGGSASIDVHQSNGSDKFTIQRWATRQGSFGNTQKWFSGSFNVTKTDSINTGDCSLTGKFAPGSKIALRAGTGKWFSRCNKCQFAKVDDTITAHVTDKSSSSAQFEVVDAGNGKIALKANTGRYVTRCRHCVVGGKPDIVTAHNTIPAGPAAFTPETLKNGKCALKADTGKYVSRCRHCSPGAKVPDTVTIHIYDPNNAPWDVVQLKAPPEPSTYPAGFGATVDTTSTTLNWTDSVNASGYLVMCSTADSFTAPVDGIVQADDTNCSDGSGVKNIAQGVGTYTWAGLNPGTPYFFRIYPYSNSGANIDYKTGEPVPATSTSSNVCSGITDGLVACYPFDGNANDASGNGNHGTVNGATLTENRFGKVDGAYSFDGTNDHIRIADTSDLDLSQEFTIQAWINPNSGYGIQRANHIDIVSKWGNTGIGNAAYLLGINNQGKILPWTYSGTVGSYFKASQTIPINNWTHVLMVRTGNTLKVYINGTLGTSFDNAKLSQNSNYDLFIGQGPVSGSNFSGMIDDIRIYNRALSEDEVKELFKGNSGANTDCTTGEVEAKLAAALKAQKEAEAKFAAEKKAKEDALAKLAAALKAQTEAEAKLAAEKKAKEEALAKLAAALKAQEEAEAKCAENGNSTELNLNDLRLVLGSASGRYYNLTEKVKCLKNNNPHNKYFIHGYSTDVPCDGEAQISGYWVWLQPHWYIWDEQVQNQPQEKP